MEAGIRRDASGAILTRLAQALGCTVDDLLRPVPVDVGILPSIDAMEAGRGSSG